MKAFKIGEKEVNLTTEWNELTLWQYLQFAKCQRDKDIFEFEELFMLKIFEILSSVEDGGLDEMPVEEIGELAKLIEPLMTTPTWNTSAKSMDIDGVTYILNPDQSKRTMGEYVSIKMIQSKYKDEVDIVPRVLSIIIRPGKVVLNEETKKEEYIIDKFKPEDIEGRTDIFLNKAKAVDIIGYLSFFLTGNQLS